MIEQKRVKSGRCSLAKRLDFIAAKVSRNKRLCSSVANKKLV